MNRRLKIAAVFFFVLAISFYIFSFYYLSREPLMCFEFSCVLCEVADTPSERMTGLMGRQSMDEDAGMLFVFDPSGFPTMWMKNTFIPLDMLWLDDDFKVVHIEYAVPCVQMPCMSYGSPSPAKYVLELNAGYVQRHNIKVGDNAIWSSPTLFSD